VDLIDLRTLWMLSPFFLLLPGTDYDNLHHLARSVNELRAILTGSGLPNSSHGIQQRLVIFPLTIIYNAHHGANSVCLGNRLNDAEVEIKTSKKAIDQCRSKIQGLKTALIALENGLPAPSSEMRGIDEDLHLALHPNQSAKVMEGELRNFNPAIFQSQSSAYAPARNDTETRYSGSSSEADRQSTTNRQPLSPNTFSPSKHAASAQTHHNRARLAPAINATVDFEAALEQIFHSIDELQSVPIKQTAANTSNPADNSENFRHDLNAKKVISLNEVDQRLEELGKEKDRLRKMLINQL
jgi:hypothetical protein